MHGLIRTSIIFLLALSLSGCATQSGQVREMACFLVGSAFGASVADAITDSEPTLILSTMLAGVLAAEACEPPERPAMPEEPEVVVADSDGDGVNDPDDRCPGTDPRDAVDSFGCPLDSDGDGVTDRNDNCPMTDPGILVDPDGCAQIGEVIAMLNGPIMFEFDQFELGAESRAILSRIGEVLRNNPGITLNVVGHTDSVGAEEYNMELGARRAEAARLYLIEMEGIAGDRLSVQSLGETEPLTANDSPAGRAENRRVEFIVSGKS